MKRLYKRHGELVTLLLLGTATKKQRRELRGIRNRLDDLERWHTDRACRHLGREIRRVNRVMRKLLRFTKLRPLVVPIYASFGVAV